MGNILEVTTHRDFTVVGNFYQTFDRKISARTEFDLNYRRNYGTVFTLFISSTALHLIVERLTSSTADTIFDWATVQTDRDTDLSYGHYRSSYSLPYLHALDYASKKGAKMSLR